MRLEWRLLMMTHNLTKIHRHQLATMGARNGPHSVTALLTTDTLPDDTPTINGPSHRPRLWATASTSRRSAASLDEVTRRIGTASARPGVPT